MLALLIALPAAAAEAPATPLPVATYVKPADFANVSLSANGRYIAALGPLLGRRNLLVLDLETMKTRAVTGLTDFDVAEFHWVGSQYLVFRTGKIDSPTGIDFTQSGGLFSVRVDGGNFRKLSDNVSDVIRRGSSEWTRMDFLRSAPGSETDILVSSNFRHNHDFDVYRFNLETGTRSILSFERPSLIDDWVLDAQGVPRVAISVKDREAILSERVTMVHYRDAIGSPWRELLRYTGEQAPWTPRAVAPNGRDLIVEARVDSPISALYRYDMAAGQLAERVAGSPRHDASGTRLRFDPIDGRLLSASTRDERYSTMFFDKTLAELHAELQAVFPGRMVGVQRSQSGQALVDVWSDRQPHTYYLFDEASAKLKLVLRSRPEVSERHLVSMQPFLLRTRDGLEIPSYYFLPANHQPGQKLPTVVHVHGGPHVLADHWGPLESFGVREAQILASRGYAVVLPNFRITPGLGRTIYEAGYGQVGRKLSDDHEDAARWAAEQGFADADRICISGASYGGYAALWATVRSAQVFRCAVAGLLISDHRDQNTSADYRHNKAGVDYWKRLLGVTGNDWSAADQVSPLRFAERSSIPLFMYAGANDQRTPVEGAEKMVAALKRVGKPVDTYLVKPGEGHGYGKLENNIELYESMLNFLDRQIGSGWKPGAATR